MLDTYIEAILKQTSDASRDRIQPEKLREKMIIITTDEESNAVS